jgi:uncharacterized protein YqjF (DUF2071 family)
MEIDTFNGQAYVSLVPFFVQAARPLGAPRAFGLAFQETNVRTYVHLDGREPGVYFFSLDAASLIATIGARVAFGLPYFWAHGREHLSQSGVQYAIHRRTGRRPFCRTTYAVGAPLGAAEPGTLDFFLIERYLLHVQRGPTLWTVKVHHQPYPLRQVRLEALEDQLVGAAGIQVATETTLVHYSPGVDVEIFPPRVREARPRRG